jgi:surface antigen
MIIPTANYRARATICGVLSLSLLAGCTSTAGNKEVAGTGIGATIGAAIGASLGDDQGSRLIGSVAGAVIGGLIGNRIGAALDAEDRKRLAEITRQAAKSGGAKSFRNRKSGVRATARVTKTQTSSTGQVCRTVVQEVVLADGRRLNDSVDACQGRNGWNV